MDAAIGNMVAGNINYFGLRLQPLPAQEVKKEG